MMMMMGHTGSTCFFNEIVMPLCYITALWKSFVQNPHTICKHIKKKFDHWNFIHSFLWIWHKWCMLPRGDHFYEWSPLAKKSLISWNQGPSKARNDSLQNLNHLMLPFYFIVLLFASIQKRDVQLETDWH